MNFEDLTPEQLEKAQACKTPEDLLALAKEQGYELSEEELSTVSGGGWCGVVCYDLDECDTFCRFASSPDFFR